MARMWWNWVDHATFEGRVLRLASSSLAIRIFFKHLLTAPFDAGAAPVAVSHRVVVSRPLFGRI